MKKNICHHYHQHSDSLTATVGQAIYMQKSVPGKKRPPDANSKLREKTLMLGKIEGSRKRG